MKRKDFLKSAISFSLLIAFHKEAQAFSKLATKKIKGVGNSRFPEITLYTSKLKDQYIFYSKTLNFPIIESSSTQFSIRIGESILRFKEAEEDSSPFYHYAINIPSNKYKKAKEWLSKKTPLLGGGLFYFDFWDAHAMYFRDPAGNIGELIARHTMDNDSVGKFCVTEDLLCISEIGTPVENPHDFAAELKSAYGLETYGETMFVGDENGLFIIPPVDRPWYPENTQKAKVYPTDITISDKGKDKYEYKDYPYKIKRKK